MEFYTQSDNFENTNLKYKLSHKLSQIKWTHLFFPISYLTLSTSNVQIYSKDYLLSLILGHLQDIFSIKNQKYKADLKNLAFSNIWL